MDRDTNYVVVGAFVVLVVALAAGFVYWYTDQKDKRTYQRYEIYFPGTVSGLSAGSPVRYLGVDVGKVVHVLLDPQQRHRVQVIADIEPSAPIDSRTLAFLNLQGITGLLYVDLEQEQDPNAGPAGPLQRGQHYPVIPSARSDLDKILSSLPQIATRMIELLGRFNQVFSDDNVRAFHETLTNVRDTSARLPETVRETQLLVADLRRASHEVESVAADLHGITRQAAPDLEATLANVRHVTDRLADTSDHLDQFVVENAPGFSRFTKQSLPQFEQLLRESREAARDFRDLSLSLKENPSQLLYESSRHGVELPR
jgi:phospholipid/cholesterol/gamma-HCH transport system substrate-binding protein